MLQRTGGMTNIHRRRPQLRADDKTIYADPENIAFVTFVTKGRRPIFRKSWPATKMVTVLRERANVHEVKLFVYCVMPDHVHLATSPSSTCDVIQYVREVKSISARSIGQGPIWQESFVERIVHWSDAGLDQFILYTLMNPVRAGLVANAADYPYSDVPMFAPGAAPAEPATLSS
jgi:REP element-mobilizing transposase RayT